MTDFLFCTVKGCHDLEQRRLLVEATTLSIKRPRKRSKRNKGKNDLVHTVFCFI